MIPQIRTTLCVGLPLLILLLLFASSLDRVRPPQTVESAAPLFDSERRETGKLDQAVAAPPSSPGVFERWLDDYLTASDDDRTRQIAAGVAAATERRANLRRLIQTDPAEALRRAIPFALRTQLPAEVVALLETPIAAPASYSVQIACGAGGSRTRRVATIDGVEFETFTHGRRLEVSTKDLLSVHGIAIDNLFAMAPEPARLLAPEESRARGLDPAVAHHAEVLGEIRAFTTETEAEDLIAALEGDEARLGPIPGIAYMEATGAGGAGADPPIAEDAWTEGNKRLLYMRVRFSDDDPASEDFSTASARADQDDVEAFLRINSYGKSLWTTTITDTLTLPNTFAYYQQNGWSPMITDARAVAITEGNSQGVDWDYNNHDFYTVVSRSIGGGYAGLAEVGGRRSHLQDPNLRTAGHEFGHNLGLPHAYYLYTKGTNPRADSTWEAQRFVEYGHRFSIMSAQSGSDFNNPALPHFTPHEKWRLDWLTDADYLDVTSAAQNGIHRVFQFDHENATGLRALRLPSGGELSKYWIGYRAAWNAGNRGSDQDYLLNGAVFNWTGSGGGVSTQIDMTPYSDDGSHSSGADWTRDNRDKWDAPLIIGRTYSDPESGTHVTPIARGGTAPDEYLDIHVHIEGGDATTLIDESDTANYIVPDANTASGNEWTEIGYNDSAWSTGPLGVGYERGSGYESYIASDIEAAMFGQNSSAWLRVPFVLADTNFVSLLLEMRHDDGFVAYINGVQVADSRAPTTLAWDSESTSNASDSNAVLYESFNVGAALGSLVVGTNVLAIHGLNGGDSSSDFLIQARLSGTTLSAANNAPTVTLAADLLKVAIGQDITFTASATDSEGDPIAYAWHFDEGDEFAPEGLNSPTAVKSWNSAGRYHVRVTASDMKGGLARDTLVVQVGPDPGDSQVHGRVLRGGIPLEGVLVLTDSKQTVTDKLGRYSFVGLAAGSREVRALLDGEVFTPTFDDPIAPDPILWGADFHAREGDSAVGNEQVVTVTPDRAVLELGESLDLAALLWDNTVADDMLVPLGATWSYLDDGSNQGSSWSAVSFDDSSWPSGPAELGYGDGDEATVVSFGGDPDNVHVTTYFRHTFNATNVAEISRLELNVRRDGGVRVFLNGVEVLRDNLTTGTINSGTLARSDAGGVAEDEYVAVSVPPTLLVEGDNVIAAEIHQDDRDSSDISFDLSLTAARNLSEVTPVWSIDGAPASATVDATGLFSATSPGSYSVRADHAGKSGTAEITVVSDLIVSVDAIDSVATEQDLDTATVRVSRSGTVGSLTVDLVVTGSATPGADYNPAPASVTIPDGQASAEFDLHPLDDPITEDSETINLVPANSATYTIGGSASVTIADNEFNAAPSVAIAGPTTTVVGTPITLVATATEAVTLVPAGADWRYLDDGSDQAGAWTQAAFNDATWRQGFAQLGYGDGDEATVVEFGGDPNNVHITTYFRRRFEVADPAAFVGDLQLDLVRDDGALVHLNGAEIVRENMPAGAVDFQTTALGSPSSEDDFVAFAIPASALVAGTNTVAVEIHQRSGSSSDISFDLELGGIARPTILWEQIAGPGTATISDNSADAPEFAFDQPGEYTLRATASNSELQTVAIHQITVADTPYNIWAAGFPTLADPAPTADPDADLLPNLAEFGFGGDPTLANNDVQPQVTIDESGPTAIVLSHRRLVDPGAGLVYVIELSNDLVVWQPAADLLTVQAVGAPIDNGDGTETVIFRLETDTVPDAPRHWFARVAVSLP